MPPEAPDLDPAVTDGDDPITAALQAVEDQIASTPANIRNSPEFQALATRARADARRAGTALRNEQKARGEVESLRQAAEAERQAAVQAQLDSLGPEAIEAFNQLAEMSATDPVAAATMLAELMANAQSAPAGAAPAAPAAPPTEASVPAQAPPPMSAGAAGDVPLQTPENDGIAALRAQLDQDYASVVERNLNATTRNRVTMRDRAKGFIAYMASSYLGNEELARISRTREPK